MTAGIRSRRASRLRDRRSARLRRSGSVALVGALIAALSIGAVPAFAVGTPTPTPDASSTSEPTPEVTETETPKASPQNRSATDAMVTPFATNTSMDVVVRKRALANPTQLAGTIAQTIGTDVTGTTGAVFRLYSFTTYAAGPQSATTLTCTITANGACTIVIPNANVSAGSGGNQGKRFWVVEEAPLAGSDAAKTYANPTLFLGSYQGPTNKANLVGVTTQVAANTTITLPMTSGTANGGTAITASELGNGVTPSFGASFGAVANSWKNPAIVAKCEATPLRISLVLDQSASISANQWTTFRNALVGTGGVLSLLRDADAQVSILGFGTSASGNGNGWHFGGSGPQSLTGQNLGSLIPTSRPGGSQNATNWDAALSTIQDVNATHNYDLVLFITDGAPNYVFTGGSQVDGYNVTQRSLEAPIYAANALKHDGVRVVAVGVGGGITGAGPNLRAVSGEVKDSDYFQTTDWDELEKQLADIVKAATCQVPVEVSKTTVNAAGQATVNASGWQFAAAKASGAGTLQGASPQTTTAGPTGTVNWTVRFTQPSGQTASVTLTETARDGWVLTGVQCRIGGGALQDQTIVGGNSVTIAGLTPTSEKLSCVFTNTEKPKAATVVVDKVWTIKDAAGTTISTHRQPAAQGESPLPDGLTALPTIDKQDKQWGVVYDGFTADQKVSLGETVTIDAQKLPGCTVTSKTLTSANGQTVTGALPYEAALTVGTNAYTMTNVVTCTQTLALVKSVAFGAQSTDSWTLTATKPAGSAALAGPTGRFTTTKPVSGGVTNGVAYGLSESGGPDTYVPRDAAWACVLTGTSKPANATAASVTLGLGQNVTCTIVNTTAKLTILKKVADGSGLDPLAFALTGTPAAGYLLPAVQTTGKGSSSEWETFEIRPGHAYTLSESTASGTIAYRNLALQKLQPGTDPNIDANWADVASADVQVAAGQHDYYRFVNDKVPAIVLPLTGGTASDLYLLLGGAIVFAVISLGAVQAWRRSRRITT